MFWLVLRHNEINNAKVVSTAKQLQSLPQSKWIGMLENTARAGDVLYKLGDGFISKDLEGNTSTLFEQPDGTISETIWIVIKGKPNKIIGPYKLVTDKVEK